MKLNDAFPSKYLAAADLDGGDVMAVIADAEYALVGEDRKVIINFQGGKDATGKPVKLKPMVCNKTNFRSIAQIAGSDDSDDWAGAEIVLVSAMADYAGKVVPAVRVRAPKKPATLTKVDRGNFDVMERRKTAPVQNIAQDVADDDIPF